MATNNLPWYEYFFMGIILIISLVIGIVFAFTGGKQKTTKEYLTANRGLGILPVTLSMYMSFTSGITLLGNVAEVYTQGVQGWFGCIGVSIGYVLGAFVGLPVYYNLKVTSAFEYLKGRYRSEAVRKTGSVFSLLGGVVFVRGIGTFCAVWCFFEVDSKLQQVMYMGSAMYTPATAMEAVTPIPMWGGLLMIGGIATLYTSVGGLKAVVWADAFQGIMMLAGTLTMAILGMQNAGGIGNAWDTLKDNNRAWVTFNPNPIIRMSFWSCIFASIAANMNPSAAAVQRLCSMESLWKARIAVFGMIPLQIMFVTLTYIIGAAVFEHYTSEGCDPIVTGGISNTNQLLPTFILTVLQKPILPGLLLSILLVGALSSITSSMNTNAAITWKDFMEDQPPFKYFKEKQRATTVKIISFLYGCIGIGIAFAFDYFPGHILQVALSINTSVVSPISGMFFLGAFFPCANHIGAIVGAVCGFAFNFAMGLGSSLVNPYPVTLNSTVSGCPDNVTINEDLMIEKDSSIFFKFAFLWFPMMGTVICVIVGLIVSFITGGEDPKEADPKYIIPLFDRLFCCLPTSCSRHLWCGVKHDEPHPDDKKSDRIESHSSHVKEANLTENGLEKINFSSTIEDYTEDEIGNIQSQDYKDPATIGGEANVGFIFEEQTKL